MSHAYEGSAASRQQISSDAQSQLHGSAYMELSSWLYQNHNMSLDGASVHVTPDVASTTSYISEQGVASEAPDTGLASTNGIQGSAANNYVELDDTVFFGSNLPIEPHTFLGWNAQPVATDNMAVDPHFTTSGSNLNRDNHISDDSGLPKHSEGDASENRNTETDLPLNFT